MELKDGVHLKAKWAIRHYREIFDTVEKIQTKRKGLIKKLDVDEITGLPCPISEQDNITEKEDKKVATTYIEGRIILDIVAVVLRERLNSKYADIMTDVCVNGMPVPVAAQKHNVSEKTVKRIRIKMKEEYLIEADDRLAYEEMMRTGS